MKLLKATSRLTAPTSIKKNDFFETVYLTLIDVGFNNHMAGFIAAQAAFETGNFTSTLYKKNRNLFGMTDASGRPNHQNKIDKQGFGIYFSYYNSILDFKEYYQFKKYQNNYSTLAEYISALKEKNYFTAPYEQYFDGVQFYYNVYFNGTA